MVLNVNGNKISTDALRDLIDEAIEAAESSESIIAKLQDEISRLENKVESLEEENSQLRVEISELQEKNEELETQLEVAVSNDREDWSGEI